MATGKCQPPCGAYAMILGGWGWWGTFRPKRPPTVSLRGFSYYPDVTDRTLGLQEFKEPH